MAIQRFCAAGAPVPGFVLQNATQRPDKATERKAMRYSPAGMQRNYTTVYREDFRRWDILPLRRPFRPIDNLTLSDARFQGTTSYQTDYGPMPYTGMRVACTPQWITPTRPGPKEPKYQSFQGVTPSTLQYTPSKLQGVLYNPNPAPSIRYARYGQGSRAAQGDFSDSRENSKPNSTQYRHKCKTCPTAPVYQRQNSSYCPPKGNTQFVTSYTCDYRPWGIQTRPAIQQRAEFVTPTGPFQHATSYLSEYTLKMASTSGKPGQRR